MCNVLCDGARCVFVCFVSVRVLNTCVCCLYVTVCCVWFSVCSFVFVCVFQCVCVLFVACCAMLYGLLLMLADLCSCAVLEMCRLCV